MIAGTQKAFALPPGTAIFTCSKAALAKAATAKDRGYYFDFVEFQKNAESSMTPSTPSIGTFLPGFQARRHFPEGLDARFARQRKTNQMTATGPPSMASRCSRPRFRIAHADVCEQRRETRWPRSRGRAQAAKARQGPGFPH